MEIGDEWSFERGDLGQMRIVYAGLNKFERVAFVIFYKCDSKQHVLIVYNFPHGF